MKKFLNLLRAWWRGEEIEAEFYIPVPVALLAIAVIVFFIFKACS